MAGSQCINTMNIHNEPSYTVGLSPVEGPLGVWTPAAASCAADTVWPQSGKEVSVGTSTHAKKFRILNR